MNQRTELEIGQVLWLRVRYQIDVEALVEHPMLIADIKDDYIEIIALDKTAGKLHQLFHEYNYYIDSSNPKEKVISEDSYAQLNTKLTIEYIEELKYAKRTDDKLSTAKLKDLLKEYSDYQNTHNLEDQRIVHMTKEDILKLNTQLSNIIIKE